MRKEKNQIEGGVFEAVSVVACPMELGVPRLEQWQQLWIAAAT